MKKYNTFLSNDEEQLFINGDLIPAEIFVEYVLERLDFQTFSPEGLRKVLEDETFKKWVDKDFERITELISQIGRDLNLEVEGYDLGCFLDVENIADAVCIYILNALSEVENDEIH